MRSSKDELYLKTSRVRNTLPGTEGTYHDAVSSLDICKLDTFAERAGKKCGYSAAVVKNVIGAVGAEAQEILSTRLYRISAFGLTFEAAISGSVPSLDSPLTEENKVYVAIHPSSELKNAAGGITPIRTNGGATSVIDRIEDETTGEVGVIVGLGVFIITGWALSTSGEDEGVTVESLVDGTTATATVVRNTNCQDVRARLNVALPAGKAKVCVTTCGNGVEETPWPVYKTVNILAAEPGPAPEPLVLTSIQTTGVQEGQVNETNTTSIRGQDNLYPWDSERDSVVVHFDGQELTVPDVEFSAGNETLQFQIPQRVGEVLDDDDTLSFTVTINGAVGTIDAVWKH